MSIVEKALRRIQNAAPPPQEPRAPAAKQGTPETGTGRAVVQRAGEAVRAHAAAGNLVIDLVRLRNASMLPPADAVHRAADELRRIKWPLLDRIFGHDMASAPRSNLIQVTSSVPGEGKTYTALNLALSLARESDCEVLLLDADLHKPRLSELLGVAGRPGLLGLLTDAQAGLEQTVLRTDVDGLYLLPAGCDGREGDVAGTNRLDDVLGRIAQEFRGALVIIDSPPLLATSLAQSLSRGVGQLLVVVRALETTRPLLQEALSLIEHREIVSLLLNQAPALGWGASYGSYYGYGPPEAVR